MLLQQECGAGRRMAGKGLQHGRDGALLAAKLGMQAHLRMRVELERIEEKAPSTQSLKDTRALAALAATAQEAADPAAIFAEGTDRQVALIIREAPGHQPAPDVIAHIHRRA